MSASREKKQRRGDPEQGLTQKQRAELQEKKTAHRKTVLYTVIGIVIAILVAALLVWHSGIFQRGATALTVDGRKYTVNDVEYYYRAAMNKAYSSGLTFDPQSDLREQYMDEAKNQSFHDYFLKQATEALTETAALEKAAEAEGYALTAEDEETISEELSTLKTYATQMGYPDFGTYLKNNYGKYMTTSAFEKCLRREVLTGNFVNDYMDKQEITDEEIQAYYEEHKDTLDSFDFRTIFVDGTAPSGTDSEGKAVKPTEEESAAAMQAAKAKAEKFAAEVKAADDRGAAFAELAHDYVAEDKKDSYTEDPDYSLSAGVQGANLEYQVYGSWLRDAKRTAGDVEVVESSSGYYVVLFLDRYLDETPTVDIRHILVKAELDQEDDASTTDVDESRVPSQDSLDAAKAEAEDLLAQWEAGDKTAESFGALAEANSDDAGSVKNGGLYEKVYQGQMFDGFNDWIFAEDRQVGDTGLVENTQASQQGWHVIYFQGENAPHWKNIVDGTLRSEAAQSWMEGLTEGLEATQESGIQYVNG